MLELIDRWAVLEIAMSYCPDDDESCSKAGCDIREMLDEIEALPSIEAELVKHAKWEICSDGYYPYCSNCKNEPQGRAMTLFCPNCGEVRAERHGQWSKQMLFDDGFGGARVGYICSACRKYVPFKGNFCGECGAKMEMEEIYD